MIWRLRSLTVYGVDRTDRSRARNPRPQERSRIQLDDTQTKEPQTELGRNVKDQTDMPTVLIDRMLRAGATKTLKKLKGRGKPS